MCIATEAMSDWFWEGARNVARFADMPGDVWRISCKPTEAPRLAAATGSEDCFFDWAGGRIWVLVPPGTDLRARLGRYDGHATRVRGSIGDLPRFEPEAPGLARLTAGLRARFDPRGILKQGLMGPVAVGA